MTWIEAFARVADVYKSDRVRAALDSGQPEVLQSLQTPKQVASVLAKVSADVYKVAVAQELLGHSVAKTALQQLDPASLALFIRLCSADVYRVQMLEVLVSASARVWPATWLAAVSASISSDTYTSSAVSAAMNNISDERKGLELAVAARSVLSNVSSDVYKVDVFEKIAGRCYVDSCQSALTLLRAFSSAVYRKEALKHLLSLVLGVECVLAETESLLSVVKLFGDSRAYRTEVVELLQTARTPDFGESKSLIELLQAEAQESKAQGDGVQIQMNGSRVFVSGGATVTFGPNGSVSVIGGSSSGNIVVSSGRGGGHTFSANASASTPLAASVPVPVANPLPKGHMLNEHGVIVPSEEHRTTASEGGALCNVCMDNAPNAFLEPCHHCAICVPCAKKLAATPEHTCPQCRDKMTKVTWIFA